MNEIINAELQQVLKLLVHVENQLDIDIAPKMVKELFQTRVTIGNIKYLLSMGELY